MESIRSNLAGIWRQIGQMGQNESAIALVASNRNDHTTKRWLESGIPLSPNVSALGRRNYFGLGLLWLTFVTLFGLLVDRGGFLRDLVGSSGRVRGIVLRIHAVEPFLSKAVICLQTIDGYERSQ